MSRQNAIARLCGFLLLAVMIAVGCARESNTQKNESRNSQDQGASTIASQVASKETSSKNANTSIAPKPMNPLTKITQVELDKVEQFALKYYKFRVDETAIMTRNLRNSGVLVPYLTPSYDSENVPAEQIWAMYVVDDQFSIEKVQFYENGGDEYGDLYDVWIRDNQVGNVISGKFYLNPKPSIHRVGVVRTKSGYKVEFDNDLDVLDGLHQGEAYSHYYFSGPVVFQKDLPVFLKNIQPWYENIPKDQLLIPPELKDKVKN